MRTFLLLASLSVSAAFVPQHQRTSRQLLPKKAASPQMRRNSPRRVSSSPPLQMILAPQTVEEAIPRFWVWLAMGNGALTVGIGQMPRLLGRHLIVQRLGGAERRDGPELAVPPALLLYPEAPSVADLEAVINSELLNDIDAIVENGPRDTYLAANGMLTYEAWTQAFLGGGTSSSSSSSSSSSRTDGGEGEAGGGGAAAGSDERPYYNPLAVRAVFDPFNACSDAVNPPLAFEYVMKWRKEGVQSAYAGDLLKAKALSYAAGTSFAGIILFVADIIYEEAVMADISNHLPSLPF